MSKAAKVRTNLTAVLFDGNGTHEREERFDRHRGAMEFAPEHTVDVGGGSVWVTEKRW
jgi:hypothetical protein